MGVEVGYSSYLQDPVKKTSFGVVLVPSGADEQRQLLDGADNRHQICRQLTSTDFGFPLNSVYCFSVGHTSNTLPHGNSAVSTTRGHLHPALCRLAGFSRTSMSNFHIVRE